MNDKSNLESLPPELSVSVTGGPWLVGRKGEVLVVPGARVSVDCLYSKKRGTPEWSWSNTSKEYKTIAEKDNYRLVLDNVGLEVIIIIICIIITWVVIRTVVSMSAPHRGGTVLV